MKKIFCFGEILLRLSPALEGEWIRRASMDFHLGGAELNVANALACWNQPVQYCSALPNHYLSNEILEFLISKGIDPSPTLISGHRIGIYFLPQGADLKNTGTIYDRAYSSFSELRTGMIDWEALLKDADWFHFSAITPALNENLVMVCEEGLKIAKKNKLTISVDLNFRPKLWQYGKDPVEIMPRLVEFSNLVMGNIWSSERLLGILLDDHALTSKTRPAFLEQAAKTSESILRQFPSCKTVANTFRFDVADGINYYGALHEGQTQYVSREYKISGVQDRVGTGDCFMAGLIYGHDHFENKQEVIDFASAAAVGKFMETGDFTRQNVGIIRERMNGNSNT